MEQISKILRILLKRMPYQPFINGELNCLSMNKNKLAEAVRCYMPLYSDTEIRYMMERLGNLLQEYNAFLNSTYRDVSDDISIFDTVFHFADDILIRTNNEIMVRYEHILRWRTTTTDIAEDIFVTAFQARHDLRDYIYCKDFTWPTVIGHNNMQLRKITDKGMAENHFHLWGSAPYFHISWIWMMNHMQEIQSSNLHGLEENVRSVFYESGKSSFERDMKKCCLQAALIRLYLYSVLMDQQIELGDYYINWQYLNPWFREFEETIECQKIIMFKDLKAFVMLENIDCLKKYRVTFNKLFDCYVNYDDLLEQPNVTVRELLERSFQTIEKVRLKEVYPFFSEMEYKKLWEKENYKRIVRYLNNYDEMRWHIDQIQGAIDRIKLTDSRKNHVDYALSAIGFSKYCENQVNKLLSGERWILYEMFRRIEKRDKTMDLQTYNLFYAYLLIKEHIRGELVQSNEWVGFENFSIYQNRTGYFTLERELEKQKARMAVESCWKQNIKLLELRISPYETAKRTKEEIDMLDQAIDPEKQFCNSYYYVLHFIKKPDVEKVDKLFCVFRHAKLRREICEKTMALLQFRKQYPKSACRVLGIDAAAQEIGCRPEVFAQGFRTLKNDTCFGNTDKGYIKLPQLHVTYHVGEDFLDVIDGLRAINEAVLFLNMDCGDRLGHALALGIESEDWYKDKGFCISLPQQDYLDNVVWMYHAIVRYHIDGLDNLKDFLEAEYYKYFNAIYGRFMDMDYIKNIQKTRGKNGHKGNMLFDIHAYYDSWKLRGDIPQLYRNGYYLFDKTDISPLASYSVNWNFPRDIEVREKSEAAVLYYYYHYNGLVRIEGKKIIEKKVSADYIRGVKLIQKAMQWEISEKGIAIETNPSSNYMIGTFSKYDQHPITTFYNNGLTSERELLKSSSQIWVSINTDDQGIFNIKLENEYAFIARALEKKVDENGEKMYSKSMIYDWLDKIRKMGLNQSFLTVNDDANDKLPENARTEQYTV